MRPWATEAREERMLPPSQKAVSRLLQRKKLPQLRSRDAKFFLPSAKPELDTQQVPGRLQRRTGALAQDRRRRLSPVESALLCASLRPANRQPVRDPAGRRRGLRVSSGRAP